jgi:hypothetical protein
LQELLFQKDDGFDYTYGAQIEYIPLSKGTGFDAPKLPEDIQKKLDIATFNVFGN